MPTIQFPESPEDAQVFSYNGRLWQYDAARTAWTGVSTAPAVPVTITVTPENATAVKSLLGLGNVDNTADNDKPVSTLQQEAIAAFVPTVIIRSAAEGSPVSAPVAVAESVGQLCRVGPYSADVVYHWYVCDAVPSTWSELTVVTSVPPAPSWPAYVNYIELVKSGMSPDTLVVTCDTQAYLGAWVNDGLDNWTLMGYAASVYSSEFDRTQFEVPLSWFDMLLDGSIVRLAAMKTEGFGQQGGIEWLEPTAVPFGLFYANGFETTTNFNLSHSGVTTVEVIYASFTNGSVTHTLTMRDCYVGFIMITYSAGVLLDMSNTSITLMTFHNAIYDTENNAATLNQVLQGLADGGTGSIDLVGHPGTEGYDVTIATNKGYTVTDSFGTYSPP